MRPLARPAVTQDAARRATQQEMPVREGRAHDERDPHQGIDEAGAGVPIRFLTCMSSVINTK